jgi:hypothetical protein
MQDVMKVCRCVAFLREIVKNVTIAMQRLMQLCTHKMQSPLKSTSVNVNKKEHRRYDDIEWKLSTTGLSLWG